MDPNINTPLPEHLDLSKIGKKAEKEKGKLLRQIENKFRTYDQKFKEYEFTIDLQWYYIAALMKKFELKAEDAAALGMDESNAQYVADMATEEVKINSLRKMLYGASKQKGKSQSPESGKSKQAKGKEDKKQTPGNDPVANDAVGKGNEPGDSDGGVNE